MKRLAIDKFYGGISQDEQIGQAGSFKYGENIEIYDTKRVNVLRGEYNQIQPLNLNPITEIGPINNLQVIGFLIGNGNNRLRFHKGGVISNSITDLTSNGFNDIKTLPGNGGSTKIYNCGVYGVKGFIICDKAIRYWAYDDNNISLGFNGEASFITTYTGTTNLLAFNEKAPLLVTETGVYVGNGDKITEIREISGGNLVVEDIITITPGYTIIGMSKIGDQIYIYANNGEDSKYYLWNGRDTEIGINITWDKKIIVGVINEQNRDYVIVNSGFTKDSGLYLVNGYELTKVIGNDENVNFAEQRIFFDCKNINAVESMGDFILIPGYDGIYRYGNNNPLLPKSLVKFITTYPANHGLESFDNITALKYKEGGLGYLYIAYVSKNIDGNFYIMESLYQSESTLDLYITNLFNPGFLETHNIMGAGEFVSDKKNLEKLTIGYKMGDSRINVYTKNMDRDIKYASMTTDYSGEDPKTGDVYTCGGNAYTLYNIQAHPNSNTIRTLFFTYEGTANVVQGTFTRQTGDGINSFFAGRVRNGYKLIDTITDSTKRRQQIKGEYTREYYHELSLAFELFNYDNDSVCELNDIQIYYQVTNDD